jgi:hypothetical protein
VFIFSFLTAPRKEKMINPIQKSPALQESQVSGITEMKAFAGEQERTERVIGHIGPMQVDQQPVQLLPSTPTPSSVARVATSSSDNGGQPSLFIQICRILTFAFISALISTGSSLSSTKKSKQYEGDQTVEKNLATHIGMGIFFIVLSVFISFALWFAMRKKRLEGEGGRVASSTTTTTLTKQGGEVIQVVQTTTADPDHPSRNGETIGGCFCYCTCCIGYSIFNTILVLIVYAIAPPTGLYVIEQQGTSQGSTRY